MAVFDTPQSRCLCGVPAPPLLGPSSIEQERHRIPVGYEFGRSRRSERGEPFQKVKCLENIGFLYAL